MSTEEGYEEEIDEELPSAMEDTIMASPPQNSKSPPSHSNRPATTQPAQMKEVKKENPSGSPNPVNSVHSPTPPQFKKEPLSPTKPLPPKTNPIPTPVPANLKAPAPFIPMGANILPANSMMLNQEGLLPMPSAQMAKRVAYLPEVEKQQRLEAAEARVQTDPFDTDAWIIIVVEAQLQPIEKARDTYERFFAIYPTAGRYWKYYAEQEMAAKNYDRVENIFLRCLRHCPNIDLWRTYITYIRTVKGETAPTARDEVRKAFEFALEHMGMDISSTQIWQDFLTFLKNEKASNPFEEGNKMTAIRKLFQRATENPMHNLEAIWKDYDQFENNLSKILAKALLTEQSPKYMGARVVYRERKSLMEGILRNMLARPPKGTIKEEHQVRLWRRLINYEKTNPQRLDPAGLRARVTFTYNQCLLCLYHYPDMWLEFANYQNEAGAADAAIQVFDRALLALPGNLFMHFAYADFLESNKKITEARDVYEKFMQAATPDALVVIQYMRFARRTEGIEGPRKIFKRVRPVCAYFVFIALAHIEFFVNKNQKNARDVFEDGLKRFPQESAYALQYIEFMKQLNEDNNTRALYERILLTLPKEKAQELWASFAAFECSTSGDLSAITKLEKRRSSVYPEADQSGVFSLVDRYKYLNLWPCTEGELESFSWSAHTGTEEDIESTSTTAPASTAGPTARFPRPDVTSMVLYRPEMSTFQPTGSRSPVVDMPPVNIVPSILPLPSPSILYHSSLSSLTPLYPPSLSPSLLFDAKDIPPQPHIPQPIPPTLPPALSPPPPNVAPPFQAPIQNLPPHQPNLQQPNQQQQQPQQQQQQQQHHPQQQQQQHQQQHQQHQQHQQQQHQQQQQQQQQQMQQPQQMQQKPPHIPNQPPQNPQLSNLPDFIQKLASLLPPPNLYHYHIIYDLRISVTLKRYNGPIVIVDALIASIRDTPLPPPPVDRPSSPTHSVKPKPAGGKRKNDEDSDEEPEDKPVSTANRPPVHDIYRNRQAQKLSKLPRT